MSICAQSHCILYAVYGWYPRRSALFWQKTAEQRTRGGEVGRGRRNEGRTERSGGEGGCSRNVLYERRISGKKKQYKKKCFNMELVYKTSAFITAFSIKGNFGSFLSAFVSPTPCLRTLLCNLFWSPCPLCHMCPFAPSFLPYPLLVSFQFFFFGFTYMYTYLCTHMYTLQTRVHI